MKQVILPLLQSAILFENTQRKPASCRNQPIELLDKSINWFPHNTSSQRKTSQNRP